MRTTFLRIKTVSKKKNTLSIDRPFLLLSPNVIKVIDTSSKEQIEYLYFIDVLL